MPWQCECCYSPWPVPGHKDERQQALHRQGPGEWLLWQPQGTSKKVHAHAGIRGVAQALIACLSKSWPHHGTLHAVESQIWQCCAGPTSLFRYRRNGSAVQCWAWVCRAQRPLCLSVLCTYLCSAASLFFSHINPTLLGLILLSACLLLRCSGSAPAAAGAGQASSSTAPSKQSRCALSKAPN